MSHFKSIENMATLPQTKIDNVINRNCNIIITSENLRRYLQRLTGTGQPSIEQIKETKQVLKKSNG